MGQPYPLIMLKTIARGNGALVDWLHRAGSTYHAIRGARKDKNSAAPVSNAKLADLEEGGRVHWAAASSVWPSLLGPSGTPPGLAAAGAVQGTLPAGTKCL